MSFRSRQIAGTVLTLSIAVLIGQFVLLNYSAYGGRFRSTAAILGEARVNYGAIEIEGVPESAAEEAADIGLNFTAFNTSDLQNFTPQQKQWHDGYYDKLSTYTIRIYGTSHRYRGFWGPWRGETVRFHYIDWSNGSTTVEQNPQRIEQIKVAIRRSDEYETWRLERFLSLFERDLDPNQSTKLIHLSWLTFNIIGGIAAALALASGFNLIALTHREVQRRKRIQAGLCPSCKYQTKGLTTPTCPECGNPLP